MGSPGFGLEMMMRKPQEASAPFARRARCGNISRMSSGPHEETLETTILELLEEDRTGLSIERLEERVTEREGGRVSPGRLSSAVSRLWDTGQVHVSSDRRLGLPSDGGDGGISV